MYQCCPLHIGEKWLSFLAGKNGSPGGPVAIATIVLIIADDLQWRGVNQGNKSSTTSKDPNDQPKNRAATSGAEEQAGHNPNPSQGSGSTGGGRRRGGGQSRASFANRVAGMQRASASSSNTPAEQQVGDESAAADGG